MLSNYVLCYLNRKALTLNEYKWIAALNTHGKYSVDFFYLFVLTKIEYTRALMETEIIFCFTLWLKQGQNSY